MRHPHIVSVSWGDHLTFGEGDGRLVTEDALARRMDSLEERIAELRAKEEVDSKRPDLDGKQVMDHLGITPGREVGQALDFLLELRLEEGPLGEEEAYRRLDAWWAERAGT